MLFGHCSAASGNSMHRRCFRYYSVQSATARCFMLMAFTVLLNKPCAMLNADLFRANWGRICRVWGKSLDFVQVCAGDGSSLELALEGSRSDTPCILESLKLGAPNELSLCRVCVCCLMELRAHVCNMPCPLEACKPESMQLPQP